YSVSHDLKGPLRIINGYSAILQKKLSDKIDNDNFLMLVEIQRCASRIDTITSDLLLFSSMNKKLLVEEPVDFKAMFEEVVEDNKKLFPGIRYQIVIENTPKAKADKTMIRYVVSNLISNAFKYSSKSNQPIITCGGYSENGSIVYYVKDNGVGFDNKYL